MRRILESGKHPGSMIFWGPPGCGKTTLARLVAQQAGSRLEVLSAVESGVKELRLVAERARVETSRTLVFIDEIHRYTRTQQDALLPHLESGLLSLLGATTESPRGCLVPALLSRCQTFRLRPLAPQELRDLLEVALGALGAIQPELLPGSLDRLVQRARGDARVALSLLEQAVLSSPINAQGRPEIGPDWIDQQFEEPFCRYNEADHHACLSAFIKSIRGSDPQAALYWMGRMVAGGESLETLTRRLRVSASEDIGLADPQAIIHTQACCQSAESVGYPEARYPLAQAVIYLCLAPKSNSLSGYFVAEDSARATDSLPVPAWLAPGGEYRSPHSEPSHFRRVSHLPSGLEKGDFYRPGELGYEARLRVRMQQLWENPEEGT